MKSRINLHGLRASATRGAKSVAQALRRMVALSLVLLLLPVELLAQQAYPYKYETTHTVPEIVTAYAEKTAEELQATRVEVSIAGRMLPPRLITSELRPR